MFAPRRPGQDTLTRRRPRPSTLQHAIPRAIARPPAYLICALHAEGRCRVSRVQGT